MKCPDVRDLLYIQPKTMNAGADGENGRILLLGEKDGGLHHIPPTSVYVFKSSRVKLDSIS